MSGSKISELNVLIWSFDLLYESVISDGSNEASAFVFSKTDDKATLTLNIFNILGKSLMLFNSQQSPVHMGNILQTHCLAPKNKQFAL